MYIFLYLPRTSCVARITFSKLELIENMRNLSKLPDLPVSCRESVSTFRRPVARRPIAINGRRVARWALFLIKLHSALLARLAAPMLFLGEAF